MNVTTTMATMRGRSLTLGIARRVQQGLSCTLKRNEGPNDSKKINNNELHIVFNSILPSTLIRQVRFVPAHLPFLYQQHRHFHSEAEFHSVADETLDAIQDAMEELFEEISSEDDDLEVNFASGVLTIALPPHGTWVINKQTPNRQLWWSSPLSGPRRYEYDNGQWVFTRSMEMMLRKKHCRHWRML